MSVWISAYCRNPILGIAPEQLVDYARRLDLMTLASGQGLDGGVAEAAAKHLRIESRARGGGEGHVLWLYVDEGVPITIDFVDSPAHQEERLVEDPTLPTRVRAMLEATQSSVHFCLKQSHVDGIGWPVSFQLAMHIGELAEGIVDADEVWWDPQTFEEID